jgi:DNA-binding XRE family transcriptional regulator
MKKFRLKHSYTQAQLAKMIGVTRSTLSHWEIKDRKPTFFQKLKIAFFFFKYYIGIRQKVG